MRGGVCYVLFVSSFVAAVAVGEGPDGVSDAVPDQTRAAPTSAEPALDAVAAPATFAGEREEAARPAAGERTRPVPEAAPRAAPQRDAPGALARHP